MKNPPLKKISISNRKPLYGVGINDADYVTNPKVNGRTVTCPYYKRWSGMLERCYSTRYQLKKPTYIGCTVCDEWLYFSNFRNWMATKDWQGKQLDKDILVQNNKIYSPKTCTFVDSRVNSLISENNKTRGKLMLGVTLHRGKYLAQCQSGGVNKWIGEFDSEIEAHNAYSDYKLNLIRSIAETQSEDVKLALMKYKIPSY